MKFVLLKKTWSSVHLQVQEM